eukprot:TRINITY_DN9889_c0_g1_i1.p1 TRINITY_DN9889_c0_g1~~TRINITY_DN9889_c0_g1_i1.p1  ORF type:complete len:1364 (+),score=321.97 TRINITY_DN9889_c0_g1_i1:123-4214(+)
MIFERSGAAAFVFLCCIVLIHLLPVSGCLYYVSPTGIDKASCGSISDPCHSIAHLMLRGKQLDICLTAGSHTSNSGLLVSRQNVTIHGLSNAIVDCAGQLGWTFANSNISLSNIMFTGCRSDSIGAAVHIIDGFTASVQQCLFVNNTIRSNFITAGGAALTLEGVTYAAIDNSYFFNNSASTSHINSTAVGSAIFSMNSTLLLTQTTIMSNAGNSSSAVFIQLADDQSAIVDSVEFVGNIGHGLDVHHVFTTGEPSLLAQVRFTNCTAIGNSGGGLFIHGVVSMHIHHCTAIGNGDRGISVAADIVDCVECVTMPISIGNSTIVGNTNTGLSVKAGGGNIQVHDLNVELTSGIGVNVTLYGNDLHYYPALHMMRCNISNNNGSYPEDGVGLNLNTVLLSEQPADFSFVGVKVYLGALIVANNSNPSSGVGNIALWPFVIIVVEDVQSIGGYAYGGGAGFSLQGNSPVWFQRVTVANNVAALYGGGMILQAEQGAVADLEALVFHSNFTNNQAMFGGGIFASGIGALVLRKCFITDNIGTGYGGGISANGLNFNFEMELSHVRNNNATFGGGIYSQDVALTVLETHLSRNNAVSAGGGILINGGENVQLIQFNVEDCTAATGAGLAAYFGVDFMVAAVTFARNSASVGGGVFVAASGAVQLVSGCMFINNSATVQGGAIDVDGTVTADQAYFDGNTAPNGAALFMASNIVQPGALDGWLQCSGCEFVNNVATFGGACLFWTGQGYAPLLQDMDCDTSNVAAFGAQSATNPVAARAELVGLNDTKISSVQVLMRLEDVYGQAVVMLPSPSVVSLADNAVITNNALLPRGSAVMNVTVFGKPRVTELLFQINNLACEPVQLTVGLCARGYGFSETSDTCAPCAAGTYTANTNMSCLPCGAEMSCAGATAVTIPPNMWPNVNKATGEVIPMTCPYTYCRDDAQAPANLFNASSWCGEGSHRNSSSAMCGACDSGYSLWATSCVPCDGTDAAAIALQLAELFGLVALQRVLSESTSGNTGFVMLVFVYQFAQFALYPKPLLQSLLNVFNLKFPTVNGRCPFFLNGYGQLAVQLTTPVVCILLLGLLFLLHAVFVKMLSCWQPSHESRRAQLKLLLERTSQPNAYIRTLIVLLINMYETVLEAAFNFLTCVQASFNNINVVYLYPTVACTGAQYRTVQIVLAIIIACFVIGPVAISVALFRQRKQHGDLQHLQTRYGRLFQQFRPQFFYWETVLLLRRAILLVVFVPVTGTVSLGTGKLAMLTAIVAFLTLHVWLQPYTSALDNKFETLSLVTLAALIGIFTSQNVAELVQTVLGGALLVLTGLLLIAPTVYALFRTVRDMIRKRLQKSALSPDDALPINETSHLLTKF